MDNPALDLFDGHLRSSLSRITNTSLSGTQWLQASLSIKHGGLEIRQLRSLALPAFFASAASSSDFQSQILLASACTADTQFHTYLAGQAVGLGRTKKGILSFRTTVESVIYDSCQQATFFRLSHLIALPAQMALSLGTCLQPHALPRLSTAANKRHLTDDGR